MKNIQKAMIAVTLVVGLSFGLAVMSSALSSPATEVGSENITWSQP